MAVTQAVLGLTASVIVAAVMLFASSAAWALFNLTVVTMRQRQVPAALLGRVTSLYGTADRGSEVLGAIGGGGACRYCRDPRPHAGRGHPHRWRDHPARMAAPDPTPQAPHDQTTPSRAVNHPSAHIPPAEN
jgi:hypothetical protein